MTKDCIKSSGAAKFKFCCWFRHIVCPSPYLFTKAMLIDIIFHISIIIVRITITIWVIVMTTIIVG